MSEDGGATVGWHTVRSQHKEFQSAQSERDGWAHASEGTLSSVEECSEWFEQLRSLGNFPSAISHFVSDVVEASRFRNESGPTQRLVAVPSETKIPGYDVIPWSLLGQYLESGDYPVTCGTISVTDSEGDSQLVAGLPGVGRSRTETLQFALQEAAKSDQTVPRDMFLDERGLGFKIHGNPSDYQNSWSVWPQERNHEILIKLGKADSFRWPRVWTHENQEERVYGASDYEAQPYCPRDHTKIASAVGTEESVPQAGQESSVRDGNSGPQAGEDETHEVEGIPYIFFEGACI